MSQKFKPGDLVRLNTTPCLAHVHYKVLSIVDNTQIQVQWPKDGNIGFQDFTTVVEGKNFDLVSRVDQRREQGKATDLEALRELAQQRGYKRGWAERVYQARLAKRYGI